MELEFDADTMDFEGFFKKNFSKGLVADPDCYHGGPMAEALRDMMRFAYISGSRKGFTVGVEQGTADGTDKGYKAGYKKGFQTGKGAQ